MTSARLGTGAALPVVLLPLGSDDDALDACLAALDAGTPAGTRVWLADDAQAGPRGIAIVERWLARTALQADYTRRARPIGEAAHLADMLAACGEADVLILAADTQPLPGWAAQLAACAARDAAIATATPWSNAGETVAWPRIGEIGPLPDEPQCLARAAASLPPHHPELPAAVGHALFLRGRARVRAGGFDGASFRSAYAAITDLSLRMAGLGWRNVLCETGFVARPREGVADGDDLDLLAARWPAWHARLAQFLMQDPLHALRAALGEACARVPVPWPQQDLFATDAGIGIDANTEINTGETHGVAGDGMDPQP